MVQSSPVSAVAGAFSRITLADDQVQGRSFSSGPAVPVNDPHVTWQHGAANVAGAWLFSEGKPDSGETIVAVRDLTGAMLLGCTVTEVTPGSLDGLDGQEQAVTSTPAHRLPRAFTSDQRPAAWL